MDKNKIIELLNNFSTDVFFICNHMGEISYANNAAKDMIRYNGKEAKIEKIFSDSQTNLIMYYLAECLNKKNEQEFEIHEQDSSFQVKIIPLENFAIIRMQNITAYTNIKRKLSETQTRLNFASQIAKIGCWELDMVAKKISWSTEMFRIFGVNNHQISVKKNIIREQMHKEDLPKYKDKLRKILRTGQPEEGIVRIIRPDNKVVYCRYKAEYLNYNEKSRKIVGTFQDLSELIEIQHSLEAAKELAEHLNQEKSYFLAQASHDLQQPVSAMNLFIENLLNANLNGKQQILVGKIHDSAQSLHNLLKNLLDISQLETSNGELNCSSFELKDLIETLKQEFEEQALKKGIKIKVVNCQHIMNTDKFLLERILRNYIQNALKYTKDKIIIGCLKYKKYLKITVIDNGIGVQKCEYKKIFQSYYRSNRQKEAVEGSGLGLAIVKKSADLLKAQVGVKSKINIGSQFYIRFNNQ